ncbi:MAG: glycosyltransferase N-terminal domain-containing protein, partial [Ginsengibacter sp.]
MRIVKPDLILWVKYEYWYYYLQEIKRKNIQLYLISGVYRSNQIFFKWHGGLYRKMLKSFTHFFLQNESSKENLEKLIPPEKISVTGDTRCDRVILTVDNFKPVPGIAEFCGDAKVVVAGSTWEDDEAIWIHFVKENPQMKFIIAPHEIDQQNLEELQTDFPGSILYSEWMKGKSVSGQVSGIGYQESGISSQGVGMETPHCLIIDNIGILSRLYYYATITYVGGGFGGDGLHNILEAAVFGKPVIFGPYHHKNFEAEELIDSSGGISVGSAVELEDILEKLLKDESKLSERGKAARDYIYKNAGASEKIVEYIKGKGV